MIYLRKKINETFISISDDIDLLKRKSDEEEPVLLLLTNENKNEDSYSIKFSVELDDSFFINDIFSEEKFDENISEEFLEMVISRCKNIPFEIVRTKRLIIRELVAEDSDEIVKLFCDESDESDENVKFLEPFFSDNEDAKDILIKYIDNNYKFYNFGIWGLYDINCNTLIGLAGFTPKDIAELQMFNLNVIFKYIKSRYHCGSDFIFSENHENDTNIKITHVSENGECTYNGFILEIGYVIKKEFRNKGYAFEACNAILEYANENIDYDMIFANISPDNLYSIKLANKLGFKKI